MKRTRFRIDFQNEGNEKEEAEANYFALSLLVPDYRLIPIMREINVFEYLQEVADYFGVSKEVIVARIRML